MESSSSSSSNDDGLPETTVNPNWLELPPEVTSMILLKLGAIEILDTAQKVCTVWRNICKDPSMWRTIDMHNLGFCDNYNLEAMCHHAVDRSCGQLVYINIEHFGTDDLLHYITDRSSEIRCLRLACCYGVSDEGLSEVASKLPLLEDLELSRCQLSEEIVKAIGHSCPLLRSFKLNVQGVRHPCIECDKEAIAIAENMHALRHLQLIGNKLTNNGLLAILDGCGHLESLDLRKCFNVNLEGDLGKGCVKQIKMLRRPDDSIDDYEFFAEASDGGYGLGSYDEEYPYGFSDIDLGDDDLYYSYSEGSDFSYDNFHAQVFGHGLL